MILLCNRYQLINVKWNGKSVGELMYLDVELVSIELKIGDQISLE